MGERSPLIPRKRLFSDPSRALVRLSQDGQYLSYLAPFDNNLNLWLENAKDKAEARHISESEHPVRDYCWAHTHDHVLYWHDHLGDENWQLKGYQLSTQKTVEYTRKGCQARIIGLSEKKPEEVLIAVNERDCHFHDVYLLNLSNGQKTLIYENKAYWDFIADDSLNLRIGVKVNQRDGEYHDLTTTPPNVLTRVTIHDLFSVYFLAQLRLGIACQTNEFYLVQSISANTSTISSLKLTTKTKKDIANSSKADIYDVLCHPVTNEPIAYAIKYDRKEWIALNSEMKSVFDALKRLDDGDITIHSQTTNNEEWVVGFVHDDSPAHYYRFNVASQKGKRLFEKDEEPKLLTKMYSREIVMSDGLTCVGYLSIPKELDHKKNGIPSHPVPLVLLVHGGPNFRDFWGLNATHQWLANRGYAVLSVNYRASTGYGKAHFDAGHGEWAGKIQQDLLESVNWAVSNGITEEDKVAIMGRSFGGYSTLVALSQTPDVFQCGIDIVGPANLVTMAKHFPAYWRAMRGAICDMIGCDPDTKEGKAYLKARSPLFKADKITKPLLIGHGANDIRVMQSESDEMAEALQRNNVPVTYAVFPDEGHQFLHPNNRMAFNGLVERFLGKHLGGQVEPEEPIESSMQVKVDDLHLAI